MPEQTAKRWSENKPHAEGRADQAEFCARSAGGVTSAM